MNQSIIEAENLSAPGRSYSQLSPRTTSC